MCLLSDWLAGMNMISQHMVLHSNHISKGHIINISSPNMVPHLQCQSESHPGRNLYFRCYHILTIILYHAPCVHDRAFHKVPYVLPCSQYLKRYRTITYCIAKFRIS